MKRRSEEDELFTDPEFDSGTEPLDDNPLLLKEDDEKLLDNLLKATSLESISFSSCRACFLKPLKNDVKDFLGN